MFEDLPFAQEIPQPIRGNDYVLVMFFDFVHFNLWLTTEVGSFELILSYVMLFMFQVIVSDRLGGLEHSFEIENVFSLLHYHVLVDVLKLWTQSLSLHLIAQRIPLAQFLIVVWTSVLGNHYSLRVPTCGHDAFSLIYDNCYSTSPHTF